MNRHAPIFLAAVLAALLAWSPVAHAQICPAFPTPDWMETGHALDARVRPAECTTVQQTPPDFGWPASNGSGYELTLTYPDGRKRTVTTNANWTNWDEALAPGNYSWQVRRTADRAVSRARRFTVPANATTFVVPPPQALLATVTAKAHPRGFPDPAQQYAMLLARIPHVSALLADVHARGKAAPAPLPKNRSKSANESEAIDETKRTLNALMAFTYTQNDWYYAEALRRVMNLASWDPRGDTSYRNLDIASRTIAWTVALGYDWLAPRMSADEKARVLAMLKVRAGDMYADLLGSGVRIAKHPRDSHGNQSLLVLAAISTLVAGDLPEASEWLVGSFPLAMNAVSPWGGDDGGFANGATQGVWDVGEQLLPWYVMRWATGVDLSQKAWVRNWATYQAYFMPPGAPSQVFGDGLEYDLRENRARFGKGYSYFAPSPLSRWFAANLNGEDRQRAEFLMAPPPDGGPSALPADTPNAVHLASIGWVAMHSSLADQNRTSVFFKSSPPPFGAFNHSHADQNSFVVNSGGQRLAIESGYYDDYKTAHWKEWYHHTKAKNAITFDGGQGQLWYERDEKAGTGQLSWFEHHRDFDVTQGEAGGAYGGGALGRAMRSMVYLRGPNLVLVYDNLASHSPRTWEWNVHAVNRMQELSTWQARIDNGGQSLCVDMLVGPEVRFSQSTGFPAAPGRGANQWHGKFASLAPTPRAEFIALLRVGCTAAPATATESGGIWTVNVAGHEVRFGGAIAPTARKVP